MFVIKPETRKRWETTLRQKHSVDEETARTLIDWIVSDPRVAFARPQDDADLESTVNAIEDAIDEVDLTDFGEIQDQAAVRNELIGTLRGDLELVGRNPDGPLFQGQQRALGNKWLQAASRRPQAAEPPDHLEPFINQFEDLIEDDESAFEFDDLVEIVRWVGYRTDTDTRE